MADDDRTIDVDDAGARSAPRPARPRRRLRAWIVGGVVTVLALAAVAGSLVYTERSPFCQTCHEMGPYYTAWASGPHAGHAQCVDCHVDAGVAAHLEHKPAALKEVWDHFFARQAYPTYAVDVPDARCTRCHHTVPDRIASAGPLFSHDLHETKGTCKGCHLSAGHEVTFAALRAAGVLRADAATPAVGSAPPSSASGHIAVICQQCHDQAHMKCSTCHTAPHEARGECSDCHHTGAAWGPGHTSRTDCTACHTAPKHHFGTGCAACHTPSVPFTATVYRHGADTACGTCHTAPSGHYGTSCSDCHDPSVPFAKTVYAHVAGSRCSSCHRAPANHFGTSCSGCHSPSVPFKATVYRHVSGSRCASCHHAPANHFGTSCLKCHSPNVPFARTVYVHASGSDCRSCHRPPSPHYSATCTTCHSPSVPFANTKFTHTSSSACAQCHTPPANHFGTTCASCHTPSVPFAQATFSHPATHHSYRSFACVKCHPSGYATAYCSCHNGHPPTD